MNINIYLTQAPATREEAHEAYTEVCRRMESYYFGGYLSELIHLDLYRRLEHYLNYASEKLRINKKFDYPCDYTPKPDVNYITYRCKKCKKQYQSTQEISQRRCPSCLGEYEIYVKEDLCTVSS